MTGSKQAEVWYCKAIKSQYKDPLAIFYLVEVLKQQGSAKQMTQCTQFGAHHLLVSLPQPTLVNATNPFELIELISLP